MAEGLPEFRDVAAAAARLAGLVVTTPLVSHPLLDEITGGRIFLKAEPLQRTGSFKFRGATNAVLRLPAAARAAGIVTYSSGNHGQAVAAAAAAAGIAASVFMPADAPAIKRASTASWGAEIRLYDRAREDREALALAFAEARGAAIIPPFDHPDVIAGQGTLALEIFAECRARGVSPEALLVCTGGGGLIAGCALAAAGAAPETRVYAVEPEGWDDTGRSLAAGARLANAPGGSGFCDALLAPSPGRLTFEINRARLAGGLVVSEAEVRAAMAFAFRHLKLVVEPGGAVALAALLAGRFPAKGRAVAAVLSGGNVDPAVFAAVLGESL
jgi:threonine dehydratase